MTAAIPGLVASDIIDAVEGCCCDDCREDAAGIIAVALRSERNRATEAEREKNATIAEAHGSPDIAARIRG